MKLFDTLRAVSLFEAAKGMLVLVAGVGALSLIHRDVQLFAEQLIDHLHLNPAKHYPRIFLDAAADITSARLQLLAIFAIAYALIRFIESYGLWHGKRWATWFAAFSGGLYIPFELYELSVGGTLLALSALVVNVVIVGIVIHQLMRQKRLQAA